MVFEQVLTIIFALGVGVALVAYIARPRHRGVSIAAARVGTFAPSGIAHAAPMPQVAAVEMPAVEASSSHPDVQQQSLTEVATVVPDAAAAGPAQVATVATAVADPAPAPSVPSTAVEAAPAPVAASAPRTPRKRTTRSTATKSHPRSARRTKKAAESSPADQPGV